MRELLSIEQIREEIRCQREDICLWLKIEPLVVPPDADVTQILNDFVAASGYNAIGDSWKELTRKDALTLAMFILSYSMAYGVSIIDYDVAKNLASRFLDCFSMQARFFTNSICSLYNELEKIKLSSWQPITNTTFDTGVIVVDVEKIGVLWVQEED